VRILAWVGIIWLFANALFVALRLFATSFHRVWSSRGKRDKSPRERAVSCRRELHDSYCAPTIIVSDRALGFVVLLKADGLRREAWLRLVKSSVASFELLPLRPRPAPGGAPKSCSISRLSF
jgi:hypothetical protein